LYVFGRHGDLLYEPLGVHSDAGELAAHRLVVDGEASLHVRELEAEEADDALRVVPGRVDDQDRAVPEVQEVVEGLRRR
jgi:hypothetical protein